MIRKASPERIFRSHFPKATIERRSTTSGCVYFLVRAWQRAPKPSGDGDTRAKAWADACDRCNLTALKEPDTRTAIERSRDAEDERADRAIDEQRDEG